MAKFDLHSKQWVPYSLEDVWTLFSDPKNLSKLTPDWYNATITTSDDQGLREGATVQIEMRPAGLPLGLKWVSKIFEIQMSADRMSFVDIQAAGPFKRWKHTHTFEVGESELVGKRTGQTVKNSQPGTWITDHVEYELPFSVLGSITHKIFARKNLENLFAYRKKKILEILAKLPKST